MSASCADDQKLRLYRLTCTHGHGFSFVIAPCYIIICMRCFRLRTLAQNCLRHPRGTTRSVCDEPSHSSCRPFCTGLLTDHVNSETKRDVSHAHALVSSQQVLRNGLFACLQNLLILQWLTAVQVFRRRAVLLMHPAKLSSRVPSELFASLIAKISSASA